MTQTKFKDGKSPWANTAWERTPVNMKPAKEEKPPKEQKPAAPKPVELKQAKPRKQKAPELVIDVSKLIITNDPVQVKRSAASKYDAVFNRLPMGHCIVCEPGEASRIGATLVKWLKAKGRPGTVKSMSHYERDGKGRVWLLEE